MFLSLGYNITSPSIVYIYTYNCIYLSSLSLFARLNASTYVYMSITIIILFFLSVISLHTCVFSSVKECQLNKSDAWKVYAVVGSTFLEFYFGVKSGS